MAENGPIWKFSSGCDWLMFYPLFLFFQVSPILFIYLLDRKYNLLPELRSLFMGSFVVLLLLPLYKIGFYGDLRLQAATPALVFTAVAASRCFLSDSFSLKRPLFVLLLGSQVFGAAYPFGKSWKQNLQRDPNDYSYAVTMRTLNIHNLSELKQLKQAGFDVAAQYLGRTDSAAARWLLR
jgi:hypothetical protein